MPLKFMDATGMGFSSDALRAVAYATANGAHLTSNSWGGGGYSQTLYNTIETAGAAGRLFIAAAGNDARDTDLAPDFPASYNLPNIISVAATDYTDELAGFSNYGAVNVDLGAPGDDILSTSPGGGYRYSSGTSMAGPQVAGACALTFGAAPNLTALEIKNRVLDTADPVPALTGKCVSGGRLNLGALIAASAGPVLQLKSFRLSDAVADGATGNGDGIFNPGESAVVFTEIENIGSEPASSVNGVLDIPFAPPALVVGNANTGYGDIPVRTFRPASVPLRVNIAAAAPVPLIAPLRLTLSAAGGRTRTFDIPFEVHQSLRLGGLVTQKTGGAPIAGAHVAFTGARSGQTITGADGRYGALVTEGTFTLTASAAGWLNSAPQSVTLPPENLAVNFQLGRPVLLVSPLSIAATVNPGQSATRTISVSNTGDEPLTFSWSANYRTTGSTPPLRDDFERASLGAEWVGSGDIVTGVSAAGTRSVHASSLYHYPFLHGLERNLAADAQPAYAAFFVRAASATGQSGHFQLLDQYGRRIIGFHCGNDGRFKVNAEEGGDISYPYEARRWYRIEMRNISWTAQTFDYAVDGVLVRTGIAFQPFHSGAVTRVRLANSGSGAEAWWDEILLSLSGTGWLRGTPQSSTVSPGQNAVLNLTLDASGLATGAYDGDVVLTSNEPLAPATVIPATLTVQPGPNNPPVASGATVSLDEDTTLEISLPASDPDSNPLTARVVTVPVAGSGVLFQVRANGTRGAQVSAQDLITHPERRVLYVPPPHAFGTAYAGFTFEVSDGMIESAPAAVQINLVPVNDRPSARHDTASSLTGAPIPSIPVLANDSDLDGDVLTVIAVGTAGRGTAVLTGGVVSYTPDVEFTAGTDSFTYTIADAAGVTAEAVVVVTVGNASGGDWTTFGGNPARTGNYAAALGQEPLVEAWTREFEAAGSYAVIGASRVFMSSGTSQGAETQAPILRALDLSSGADHWTRNFPEEEPLYARLVSIAWHSGAVYLMSGTQGYAKLRSLNDSDGGEIWNVSLPAQNLAGALVVTPDGIWTRAGNAPGLYGFTLSGAVRFQNTALPQSHSWSPTVSSDGTVYTVIGGTLRAHHPGTGAVEWSLPMPAGAASAATPCIANGRIFIAGENQYDSVSLVAVDLTAREVLWHHPGYSGVPAVSQDVVFAMRGVEVDARDGQTGALIRTYSAGQSPWLNQMATMQPLLTDDTVIFSLRSQLSVLPAPVTCILDRAGGALRQTLDMAGGLSVSGGTLLIMGELPSSTVPVPRYGIKAWRAVTPLNPAPAAAAVTVNLNEGGTTVVTLTGADAQGEYVYPVITTLPPLGALYQTTDGAARGSRITTAPSLVTDPRGRVIYVPSPDGFGLPYETWGYKVSDGSSLSDEAAVSVNISPVSEPPDAWADTVFVRAGRSVIITPLRNDRDRDGQALTLVSFTAPAHGSTAAEDGGIRYTPQAGFEGTDSFTYTISDGTGFTATAAITVHVRPWFGSDWHQYGNDPGHTGYAPATLGTAPLGEQWSRGVVSHGIKLTPPCVAGGVVFAAGELQSGTRILQALEISTGAEIRRTPLTGFALSPILNAPSWSNGRVFLQAGGNNASSLLAFDDVTGGELWRSPYADYATTHQAPTVADGRIWINGGAAGGLYGFSAATGSQGFFRALPQVSGWTPCYADGVLYSFVQGKLIAHHADSGATLWELAIAASGLPAFAVSDGYALLNAGGSLVCVDLEARAVAWTSNGFVMAGAPAVAAGITYAMSAAGPVRALDVKTGALVRTYPMPQVSLLGQPVVTDDSLIVTYASSTFVFDLYTGMQRQQIGTGVSLAVAGDRLFITSGNGTLYAYGAPPEDNAVPVAAPITASLAEDTQILLRLEASDADADTLHFVISSLPAAGTLYQTTDGTTRGAAITVPHTLVTSPAGQVIFVPAPHAYGAPYASFEFLGTDTRTASPAAVATLSVSAVNDAPVALPDSYIVRPGSGRNLRVLANDSDADDTVLTVVSWTAPAHGILTPAADGSFIFIADSGYEGPDSFKYEISDPFGARSAASVSLLISATAGRDWPIAGGSARHTGYQPGTLGVEPWEPGWTHAVSSPGILNTVIAVADGKVFLTGRAGGVPSAATASARDAATGALLWSRSLSSAIDVSPPAWHDGKVIFIKGSAGAEAGRILTLDAVTGADVWSPALPSQLTGFSTPVPTDAAVWFNAGVPWNGLHRYHWSGTPAWSQYIPGNRTHWIPGIAGSGRIFVWQEGVFSEHSPATGEELHRQAWPWNSISGNGIIKMPVLVEERAWFCGTPGLICFDASTWSTVWSSPAAFWGAPAVAHGEVYVFADTRLLRLHAATGAVLREAPLPGGGFLNTQQPIVTDDSIIMTGLTETFIYDRISLSPGITLPAGGVATLADGVLFIVNPNGQLKTYRRPPPASNQVPVATAATITLDEDVQAPVTLAGTDADGHALRFLVTRLPASGKLFQTEDGSTRGMVVSILPALISGSSRLIYVPEADANGEGRGNFGFKAADDFSISAEAQITLNVTPVPDAPLAAADELVCVPGQWISPLPLLGNDRDADGAGDPLTISSYTQPAAGAVRLLPSGALAYLPHEGVPPAQDAFTYTLTDNTGQASTATVTIKNDAGAHDWPTLGGGPQHRSYAGRDSGPGAWSLAWSRTVESFLEAPAAAGGRVFLTHSKSFAEGLDAGTGQTIWQQPLPLVTWLSAPTWHSGELIFQQTDPPGNSLVRALNAATGVPVWQAAYADQAYRHFAPAVTDAGVWINGGTYGGLYGYSRTGLPRFFHQLPQYDLWTPSIGADGMVYSWVEAVLRAHHPLTGAVQWSLATPWNFAGSYSINTVPAISGTRAVARSNARLHCFDLAQQALAWTVNEAFAGIPALGPAHAYAIQGNRVRSFRLTDGAPGMTYDAGEPLDGQPLVTASLLIAGSPAMITAHDGFLHVFDLATAAKLQTLPGYGPLALSGDTMLATTWNTVRAWRQTAPLTFAPSGGTNNAAITVTLTVGDPAARIYFSTDPLRPPGPESPRVQSGGTVTLAASATLAAVAVTGERASLMQSASFTITDSDGDSLPDWWELLHFPSLTTAARDGDADGDGGSDLQEFLFGTPPDDSSARPALMLELVNGAPRLTWPTAAGSGYRVQSGDDLLTWSPASPDFRGTGAPLTFNAPPGGHRFLRVQAFP
jgi:hypothetical protein